MPTIDQIRESIEARLAELKNEMTALEAARAQLRGGGTTAASTTASNRRAVKPRRRRTPIVAGEGHGADGAAEIGSGVGEDASPRDSPTGSDDAAGEAETGSGASEDPPAEASKAPTRSAGAPPGPRRRTRSKSSQSGRGAEVLLAGRLETMLSQAQDGLSAIMIAKQSNASYKQVRDLLRELESAGQIRRTGTRRTSLWRLITEEERIAARAAELESLSVAKSPDGP